MPARAIDIIRENAANSMFGARDRMDISTNNMMESEHQLERLAAHLDYESEMLDDTNPTDSKTLDDKAMRARDISTELGTLRDFMNYIGSRINDLAEEVRDDK